MTSSAVVGSSAISSAGCRHRHGDHRALAHAAGELVREVVEALPRHRDADCDRSSSDALASPRFRSASVQQWLRRSGSPIVNTGLSEVIGSWKIIAISLPRIADLASARVETAEVHRPRRPGAAGSPPVLDASGRLDQPHDGAGGHRLAAAALAETTPSVRSGAIEKSTPSTARAIPSSVWKWHLEPLDLDVMRQFGGGHDSQPRFLSLGLSVSCTASPTRLADSTNSTSAIAGPMIR